MIMETNNNGIRREALVTSVRDMSKIKCDAIPESFNSLAEAAAFWDTHDSSDYEDIMVDVDFEIDIKRRMVYHHEV